MGSGDVDGIESLGETRLHRNVRLIPQFQSEVDKLFVVRNSQNIKSFCKLLNKQPIATANVAPDRIPYRFHSKGRVCAHGPETQQNAFVALANAQIIILIETVRSRKWERKERQPDIPDMPSISC